MASQYSETNVVHFSFNLLNIKGLDMFRASLAYPQEVITGGTWYIACELRTLAAAAANLHNSQAIYQVPLM
jgi:hypothetical protein